MKALVPQIVQAVYFGALLIFVAGSLVLSGGLFNTCNLISFVTSLVFLIEPIQVIILSKFPSPSPSPSATDPLNKENSFVLTVILVL